MKRIELNGRSWRHAVDAGNALLDTLGPLCQHGSGIDAFVDSMIYGGMLETEPPYEVLISDVRSPDAEGFLRDLSAALAEAREWRRKNRGDDVEVSLRLVD